MCQVRPRSYGVAKVRQYGLGEVDTDIFRALWSETTKNEPSTTTNLEHPTWPQGSQICYGRPCPHPHFGGGNRLAVVAAIPAIEIAVKCRIVRRRVIRLIDLTPAPYKRFARAQALFASVWSNDVSK